MILNLLGKRVDPEVAFLETSSQTDWLEVSKYTLCINIRTDFFIKVREGLPIRFNETDVIGQRRLKVVYNTGSSYVDRVQRIHCRG